MQLKISILLLHIFLFGNSHHVFSSEILGTEKMYAKEYFANGNLKAEGWKSMDTKTDFWFFYHENGKVASKGHFRSNQRDGYWYFYDESSNVLKEGHFENGSAENWWIFYDIANQSKSKFQYKDNKKNGFALLYKNRKLVKAQEYLNNKKTGEWTSILAFKLDNPNVSLR